MGDEDIRRYTLDEIQAMLDRGEDRTDWAAPDAKTEEQLEADIASDPDWADIPRDWMRGATAVRPVMVDPDIAEWFFRQGADAAVRINDVLRAYVLAQQET